MQMKPADLFQQKRFIWVMYLKAANYNAMNIYGPYVNVNRVLPLISSWAGFGGIVLGPHRIQIISAKFEQVCSRGQPVEPVCLQAHPLCVSNEQSRPIPNPNPRMG